MGQRTIGGTLNHMHLVIRAPPAGCAYKFSCSTLSVPNCQATRRLHKGWDTARGSRGRGRARTMDLPGHLSVKPEGTL
ncbi:hypothetical protein T265_05119 [Opisthorchis viverrini]|uniref:Uncharacterized protein n=1 Tax=Opisthorchis viverrini TaxID=6198 RepID=A0A074ZKQ2_OPIVI|nr:hypothetical protein T265_05119 [Opisthorchis viverrini]KER27913.1 hypothetical protein T265_05119 [Opisthorchis viverrini]